MKDLTVRARRARSTVAPDRGEFTAVLNALRCGITAEDLLDKVPGCTPGSLLRAYQELEKKRRRSAIAWATICDDPSMLTLVAEVTEASKLVPVPAARVATTSRLAGQDAALEAVRRACIEMVELAANADAIEAQLATMEAPSQAGVELGRALYDPYSPGLWGHPNHLTRLVGELTPLRARDLLGERRL